MSANNRRIRRVIVELLWNYGAMTKEAVADLLSKEKNVRAIPSQHSLSALLSKNSQIVSVGSEKVENAVGASASHLVYDIDRNLIRVKEDIMYTRSPTVMTPSERIRASKCSCGKIRIMPENSNICLHCIRTPKKS